MRINICNSRMGMSECFPYLLRLFRTPFETLVAGVAVVAKVGLLRFQRAGFGASISAPLHRAATYRELTFDTYG
jgi:hypothetical protein